MQSLVGFRLADFFKKKWNIAHWIQSAVCNVISLCRTSAWSASSWCTGGCPGHCLSHLLYEQGPFLCPEWTILRTRRLALALRATQTVIYFLPQLHLVPLLIAESWLEWCEERLAVWREPVYELWDKERKRGMKQGSWSLLVIRNWTAPSCLCSAQGWMSKQIQGRTFYQPFLVRIHFYPAYFRTLVVSESCNFCIDNANRRNRLLLFKINCCSQMYTEWNLTCKMGFWSGSSFLSFCCFV